MTGPFDSPSEVEPLSAGVGVVVVGHSSDLALMELALGGAERRPARFAHRVSIGSDLKPLASAEDDVDRSWSRNGAAACSRSRSIRSRRCR
jgi:hypothetical protein